MGGSRALAVVALLSGTVAPRTADACSASVCRPAEFLPAHGAQIPANAPAVLWRPASDTANDPNLVTLAPAADPSSPIGFTVRARDGDVEIVPSTPLMAGTAYTLTDRNVCADSPGPSVTFFVGPAAPLPQQIGWLVATATGTGPLTIATFSGSCSEEVIADQVSVEMRVSAEVQPWMPLLVWKTSVDAMPWAAQHSAQQQIPLGETWRGAARDLVYSICSGSPYLHGLEPGARHVAMNAILPGTNLAARSEGLTVELRCPASPGDPAGSDDGCRASDASPGTGLALALVLLLWHAATRPSTWRRARR